MSIFENMTYEALMESVLGRVSPSLDKREGSMIWNGTAPAMAELAQFYAALELILAETFIPTASREFLILRAADRSMAPMEASSAVFKAKFNIEVSEGTRFSCEDLNFVVTGRVSEEDGNGVLIHLVTCETPGSAANEYSDSLIPIEYVSGLTVAELGSLFIPGEDEEDTEAFRQRLLDAMRGGAFGGNVADYKEKILSIQGVKDVKVYRVSNAGISPSSLIPSDDVCTEIEALLASEISEGLSIWLSAVYTAAKEKLLTVGGTVRCVILAETGEPTEDFLKNIQNEMDPVAGEGLGLAPIGHVVDVDGVAKVDITFDCTLTISQGKNESTVRERINSIIDEYFAELTKEWADSDHLTVRISQIEARILTSLRDSVIEITNSTLNGSSENLILGRDEVPIRKVVTDG